jgi:hypothetical protein
MGVALTGYPEVVRPAGAGQALLLALTVLYWRRLPLLSLRGTTTRTLRISPAQGPPIGHDSEIALNRTFAIGSAR